MGTIKITAITPITVKRYIGKIKKLGVNMFEDYDFYRASQFLAKTNQCKWIIQGVTGLLQYDEIDILDTIEKLKPCNYYMIEKLYCKIMQDMDYEVPFTLEELLLCIKNYPKRRFKGFNKKAYCYVKNLYERLLYLYPM